MASVLLIIPTGLATAQDVPGPKGAIDLPTGTTPVSGVLELGGWAIDTSTSSGTGVDRVTISVDEVYVIDAHYGASRPDIAAAFGPQFGAAGWKASLDIQNVAGLGDHVLEISAHSVDADTWTTLTRPIQVVATPRFGVDFHPLGFSLDKDTQDLDRIKANGLDTVRFEVNWDSLEPTTKRDFDPAYLAKLDGVLSLVLDRGLHPIITILRTPAWARTGGTGLTPPFSASDYADVVAMIAARYATVPGMTYEIWNEPNAPAFWDSPDYTDPTAYTALLQASYARIKAVAPAAYVLGGALVFNDPGYLQGMYAQGAKGAFDGLSLHPYSRGYAPDDTSEPTRSFSLAIAQAKGVMAEHGDYSQIWITEMGWSTAQVQDSARADYYRRAVQLVRADPQIAAFCAFELNQGDDSTAPVDGLVAIDGTPTASWNAYGKAIVGQ